MLLNTLNAHFLANFFFENKYFPLFWQTTSIISSIFLPYASSRAFSAQLCSIRFAAMGLFEILYIFHIFFYIFQNFIYFYIHVFFYYFCFEKRFQYNFRSHRVFQFSFELFLVQVHDLFFYPRNRYLPNTTLF